jgi:hypothetical protein
MRPEKGRRCKDLENEMAPCSLPSDFAVNQRRRLFDTTRTLRETIHRNGARVNLPAGDEPELPKLPGPLTMH